MLYYSGKLYNIKTYFMFIFKDSHTWGFIVYATDISIYHTETMNSRLPEAIVHIVLELHTIPTCLLTTVTLYATINSDTTIVN